MHGGQHFTPRGRSIGGFQVSGKSSCPSCCGKRSRSRLWNFRTTLETGQLSLKTDSGSRVIVWRLSQPSARRRAPVPPHTCCFTQRAWQLVAGNVHVSRGRDGQEDLREIPGRDTLEVSSCCRRFELFVSFSKNHAEEICIVAAAYTVQREGIKYMYKLSTYVNK